MDIKHIDQPSHQGPGLLRIPAPIMSPRLLRPKHAREHAESQKCCTYIYKGIRSRQDIMRTGHQTRYSKNESAAKQRIREHVHGNMRNEPSTLQRRHECLVLNLRPCQIQDYEHSRKDSRERQDPPVPPLQICQQTRHKCKERIPQSRLAHSPHWRTLKRYPQTDDECREHGQGTCSQSKSKATTATVCHRRSRPMVIGTQRHDRRSDGHSNRSNSKPYEYVPRYHDYERLEGPPIKSNAAPARSMITPNTVTYFHGSRTISNMQYVDSEPAAASYPTR